MIEIICRRCRKPVDLCEVEDAPATMNLRVTVFCHGERDECSVSRDFIADFVPAVYEAFALGDESIAPSLLPAD